MKVLSMTQMEKYASQEIEIVGQFRRDVKRGLKLFKEKNKEWKKSRYGK
jgi:hypothetical protein